MPSGKKPKIGRISSATAARELAIAAMVLLVFAFGAHAKGRYSQDRCQIPKGQACIETPAEYRAFWEDRRVGCVDSSLYVTVAWGYDSPTGGTTGDTHLYPRASVEGSCVCAI